jgi:PleD family two-component response regulator
VSGSRRAEALLPIADRLTAVRVLVVEEDDDTRELLRVLLESAGASVDVVATAKDARRELLAAPPQTCWSRTSACPRRMATPLSGLCAVQE